MKWNLSIKKTHIHLAKNDKFQIVIAGEGW